MADFDILITDSGTLPIAVNTRLTYAETAVIGRNARGVLYSTSLPTVVVLLPTIPDDEATRAWVEQGVQLNRALEAAGNRPVLPALALGQHQVFACDVVVMAVPLGNLATTIQQLQQNNQWLAAERLGLQTALDLLNVLNLLRASQQTLRLNTLEVLQLPDQDGITQPALIPWEGYLAASEVVALNAMQTAGRWLYRLLCGFSPRPPFNPFDDTTWQGRTLPYQPQGVISVGLRYLLTALFQAPADQRFVREDGSFDGLYAALHEWHTLTLTLGVVIDQQSADSLSAYNQTLPTIYQFEADGTEAQAIWLDLWLRIHQTSESAEALATPTITRSHALLRAKVDHNADAQAQEAINRALAGPDLTNAIAILQEQQAQVRTLAERRDVTLWGLWQHLGRWQLLLGLTTPREVVRHIGTTLHRSPLEDSAPALDILVNTLEELNLPHVLREVRLRQSALSYRQNETWQAFSARFAGELAALPAYLQLPLSAGEDLFALPYTLQGQLVGSLGDVVSRVVEAITAGNQDAALALTEYARTLPFPLRHSDSSTQEVETLSALARFLRDKNTALSDFTTGAALLQSPSAQQEPLIRQRVEQRLLEMARQATEQVEAAVERRDWATVRNALPAYHLLTQRETRHLIEQLRVSSQQEARSLQQSSVLHTYGQIQKVYQALFLKVKQQALTVQASPQQQQDAARAIMNTLQEAVELGLPMDDIIASDDATRQQWQQLITDALGALQRVEHVTQDVEALRQRLHGDGSLGAQLETLNGEIDTLREQINGSTSASPGLLSQLQGLRTQISEMEKTQLEIVEQSKREMRVTQDDIQRQLEAQEISGQRHTQQIAGNSNLLQDARERLAELEQQIASTQEHEGQLLCSYLDAMPDPQRIERINAVLDTMDGLVYAMRRCPTDAYSEGVHTAWLAQLQRLRERFDALTKRKLSLQERRTLKTNLSRILKVFEEVEREANTKAAAYARIVRPADRRS